MALWLAAVIATAHAMSRPSPSSASASRSGLVVVGAVLHVVGYSLNRNDHHLRRVRAKPAQIRRQDLYAILSLDHNDAARSVYARTPSDHALAPDPRGE